MKDHILAKGQSLAAAVMLTSHRLAVPVYRQTQTLKGRRATSGPFAV